MYSYQLSARLSKQTSSMESRASETRERNKQLDARGRFFWILAGSKGLYGLWFPAMKPSDSSTSSTSFHGPDGCRTEATKERVEQREGMGS